MTTRDPADEMIALLQRWRDGDARALDKLMPRMYTELRSLAIRQKDLQVSGRLPQTIARVNQAYMRIVGSDPPEHHDYANVATLAAQATRRLMVDFSLRLRAGKFRESTVHMHQGTPDSPAVAAMVDVIQFDLVLSRLARINPRQAGVVELRYFGGLTVDETAQALNLDQAAVERDWRLGQAWLRRELDRKAEG